MPKTYLTPTKPMRYIQLTQGMRAIVDDADYVWLSQWSWFSRRTGRNLWYAVRTRGNGHGGSVYMHREIMGASHNHNSQIDHRNGNGLDNRRANLRFCNHMQNARGVRTIKLQKSVPYRGVTPKRDKFRARIVVNKTEINLGSFSDPAQAALAYDTAARQYFGEFAAVNF